MILWIDDEINIIKRHGDRLCEELGLSIHYAADIATALARLQKSAYDLIIVDIAIPLGSLPDPFKSLASFFETHQKNAGFGLLTLAQQGEFSSLKQPLRLEKLVACTNYQSSFFERYLNAGSQSVAFFAKLGLIDRFPDFLAICRSITGAASREANVSNMPALVAEETAFERAVNNIMHELKRSMFRSDALIENMLSRYAGVLPGADGADRSALFGLISREMPRMTLAQEKIVDRVVDAARGKQASIMDAVSDAYQSLRPLAESFNAGKVTLLDDQVKQLIKGAYSYSDEVGRSMSDAAFRVISLLQQAEILDLRRSFSSCLDLLGSLEHPSSALKAKERSFFPFDIIQEVCRRQGPAATKKHIFFRVGIEKIRNSRSFGSTEGFEKIIENLVENAIKYSHRMPEKKSWVSIDAKVVGKKLFRISVENWGAKIEEVELKEVAEIGMRGKHAIGDGTGRGLTIVREELDKLGGDMEIASRRDGTFRRRQHNEDLEAYVNTVAIIIPVHAT